MPDTDPSGLWPKADTLAAGDEELLIEPDPPHGPREADSGWREDDDWHTRHPEDP